MREGMDTRRSQNITELVVLREQEKQLKFELDHSRDLLLREQERVKVLMQQVQWHLVTIWYVVFNCLNTRYVYFFIFWDAFIFIFNKGAFKLSPEPRYTE